MRKVIGLVLVMFVLLSLVSVSFASDFDGELKQLRFEYSKIRGLFILYNNSGKDYSDIKVQIALLDKKGKVITVTTRWFMNIPSGLFSSTSNLFWDGTTKNDLSNVNSYSWRILFLK